MSQNYPGNSSLPAEVRQRVITTFKQSVDLFRQGNRDDALAGCDYVLKMDPTFDPARQLMEKIENPIAPVDVDNLLASVAGGVAIDDAREALRARDFARVLDITSEILRSDFTNLEAQQVAEEAQAKLEAAPFIDQFLSSARNKLSSGNFAGAASDVQKAKQLDDDHPAVLDLERQLVTPQQSEPAGFSSPFGSGFSSSDPFGAPTTNEGFSAGFGSDFGSPAGSPPAQQPASPPPSQETSFVVDTPSASGTQASDFGFTFEEEQPSGGATDFSFGSPSPFGGGQGSTPFGSPAVSEGQTFDFATASVETTEDDRKQIAKYIEDGDAAFEVGDYQKAIDIWSKVFLIDVTNDEASHRIEKARAKRQEVDRRIEELMVAGTLAFEKRDSVTARAKFEEVLALDPNHFNAREYMDRIEAGEVGGGVDAGPAPTLTSETGFLDEDLDYGSLREQPLVPPDAATATTAAPSKAKVAVVQPKAAAKSKLPLVPILAVVGLLVLGGGGYFAYTKFAGGEEASDPAATQAVFSQAERLAAQGKFDEAIRLLSGVPAGDPQHDRALEMIDDLKERKAQAAGTIGGRPAAMVFNDYLNQARTAYAARDYLTAKQMLEQALAIQPLPPDARQMLDEANQQVGKLESALLLLREGRYNEGIENLNTILAQDPANETVKQLLGKAHFNYAVAYLQQENTQAALAELDKVLSLVPNDAEARRTRELASKYDGQPKDLLFKIYVKYLPVRAL